MSVLIIWRNIVIISTCIIGLITLIIFSAKYFQSQRESKRLAWNDGKCTECQEPWTCLNDEHINNQYICNKCGKVYSYNEKNLY